MKTIGIIVAMQKELEQIGQLLDNPQQERRGNTIFVKGNIGSNTFVLQQCGIGKVNAALGAQELIRSYAPELIISTGCAGGANASVNVGDVVVSRCCAYHDVYCGPENLSGQVQGMPAAFASPDELVSSVLSLDCGVRLVGGKIASGDWFVDTREKLLSIIAEHPDALAVDMESAAIAHTCYLNEIPFLSLRIISDNPLNENQPRQYADFWAEMATRSFAVVKTILLNV